MVIIKDSRYIQFSTVRDKRNITVWRPRGNLCRGLQSLCNGFKYWAVGKQKIGAVVSTQHVCNFQKYTAIRVVLATLHSLPKSAFQCSPLFFNFFFFFCSFTHESRGRLIFSLKRQVLVWKVLNSLCGTIWFAEEYPNRTCAKAN